MAGLKTPSADDRAEAARLLAEGRAAEAARNFGPALDCYRRSLALVDDPTTLEALQHLMRLVGPM